MFRLVGLRSRPERINDESVALLENLTAKAKAGETAELAVAALPDDASRLPNRPHRITSSR